MLCCFSCNKKSDTVAQPVTGNYLIIGYNGGFVSTEAKATYYMINDNGVWLDSSYAYSEVPTDVSKFRFTNKMPDSLFAATDTLRRSIPTALLSKNNQHIGQYLPDAGYMDVRTSISGQAYRWYFEANQDSSSLAIQN
ncbi:MAG: hypothetical protein EBZ77_04855, partial [Chitinophagia bacterium]|nr:hypothetical protein [Chitinophagia bacterium]